MPNHLQNESSPYLIQHKENPVDWYPWCKEALDKAKESNKPIFLSIGYSTCHWCHVMAHESFEDKEVAELMNEAFICIKVDREERPDLDGIYMTAAQLLTGSGGWPLNVVLTPDQKPFFGGTYFPKTSRFGRIGMLDLIPRINEAWQTNHEKALESAESLTNAINSYSSTKAGEALTKDTLKSTFDYLSGSFDETYGGFGDRPKFPTPHNLMFLLRYWKSTGESKALAIVTKTLKEMYKGGIWDHIGYGFHRYSTDREWLLPHFEKMLYDQALLALAFIEAFQATKESIFKEAAEQTLEYVLRDMTSDKGSFYSAEDADSEGEEGKFYVWSTNEIKSLLNEQEAKVFTRTYNIKEDGNFLEEATRKLTGANIPHLQKPLSDIAKELGLEQDSIENTIEECRQKLFTEREKRVRPLRDDKVLTDWNSLMIKAIAKAGKALKNSKYLLAAERATEFILQEMQNSSGELIHSSRKDKKLQEVFLDDYAFLVDALIQLYQATLKVEYLQTAINLTNKSFELFWDDEDGGFFIKSKTGEHLITNQKEIYDGAIPSGNSVAFSNLLKLHLITGNSEFEEKAIQISKAFSDTVERNPAAYTQLMCGLDFAFNNSKLVFLSCKKENGELYQALDSLKSSFEPNQLTVLLTDDNKDSLSKLIKDIEQKQALEDKLTAYICTNKTCSQPITDLKNIVSS